MSSEARPLISVQPDELKFNFELEKQSSCNLTVSNNTEYHVAFKVKTTSPRKYFVKPNTSVIQPHDSCSIRGTPYNVNYTIFREKLKELECADTITLQAQQEYPTDLQAKDKFLLQSTIVPPNTDVSELSTDTFDKDGGRTVEECRLKVVYDFPSLAQSRPIDDVSGSSQSTDNDATQHLQRMKDERDAAVRQVQSLQRDVDMLKRERYQKNARGFSLMYALIVALIGIMIGFILGFASSARPLE